MRKYTSLILEKSKTIKGLNLLNPVMDFLNKGEVFKLIHLVFALACAMLPLFFFYRVYDSGFFRYAKIAAILGLLFVFVVVLVAAVFGCRYWLERSEGIQDIADNNAEFIGIPLLTRLIQDLGEWAGVTLATAGTAIVLVGGILGGDVFGLDEIGGTVALSMVLCVVAGFAIILATRVASEIIKLLTYLAHNIKR